MNLTNETDASLVTKTETLVREERELLSAVLYHLHEIQRRRLYSALGYKSLFDFTVRRLGYSEDQAYRRISAMKLMSQIPEVEQKINAGEISLTHIGLAQSLFRSEQKHGAGEFTNHQKLEVLNQIASKPVREAERITLSLSSVPAEMKPDKSRAISEGCIELKFTAKNSVQAKIETLKGLFAHKNPNINMGELFEKLCDLGIEAWNPGKTAAPKKRCAKTVGLEGSGGKGNHLFSMDPNMPVTMDSDELRSETANKPLSQAAKRRLVFANAKNACQKCGSQFALEMDHIYPRALGGSAEVDNLRVLCRSCNQRAAIEVFGRENMNDYLN